MLGERDPLSDQGEHAVPAPVDADPRGEPPVLLVCYVFAFTVSFPEGRYLAVDLPCYAFFITVGVRHLMGGQLRRVAALASLLLLTTANTAYLVAGDYNRYMQDRFRTRAGTKDAVRILREDYSQLGQVCLSPLVLGEVEFLNFQMYANFKLCCIARRALMALVDKRGDKNTEENLRRIIVVREQADNEEIKVWLGNGFRVVGAFTEAPTGKSFVLLAMASSPFASLAGPDQK